MKIDFRNSLVSYSGHGVSFEYPDIWELTEEVEDDDVVLTVSSASTVFWMLRLLPGCPPPPQVVNSCVSAFNTEYDEVEEERFSGLLSGMPADCRELNFFCMELMNTAELRCVRTTDFTMLVWWQATHDEAAECREMLQHMTESVVADSCRD